MLMQHIKQDCLCQGEALIIHTAFWSLLSVVCLILRNVSKNEKWVYRKLHFVELGFYWILQPLSTYILSKKKLQKMR